MPNQNSGTTVVRTNRGLSIAGTRITLYDIMDYVKAGWSANRIRRLFDLTERQVNDVMAYIVAHRDDVEAEYALILDQAEATRAYWEERNREHLAEIAHLPPKPGQEVVVAKLRARKAELGLP